MKHLTTSFAIILSCIFHAITINAQPKCYFEHYGSEDGLPQHTVMDILQDQKGFMWFSTWDGLSKFDGYEFKSFKIQNTKPNSIRSNRINKILEDTYGFIWTLSDDNRAYRFDPEIEQFTGLNKNKLFKDKSFATSQIVIANSGKVWLLSENSGCVCVEDSTFNLKVFSSEHSNIKGDSVFHVHEDRDLNTWILTNKGVSFDNANEVGVNAYDNLKNNLNQVFYCVLERADELFFGSDNGTVWKYNMRNEQFQSVDLHCKSKITSLQYISDDNILIITESDGFFIFNTSDSSFDNFGSNNLDELKTNIILSAYIDKSSNIWLETDLSGVSKFNIYTKKLTTYTPMIESNVSSVFPPNFIIFEDKDNRLWVHPVGGGFSLYDALSDKLVPFYNKPFASNWMFSNMLHSAFSDKQGNLWLGTRSHGLEKVVFYDENFKTILPDLNIHSTVNNDVRPIFQDNNHNIWVGTKEGKVYLYDKNLQKIGYLTENGTIGSGKSLNGVAYCITQDSKHNIWIGTKGEGIYKLIPNEEGTSFKIINYKNDPSDNYSLSNNDIYSIFEDSYNRIWIGTYGGGINLLQENDATIKFINHRNLLRKYPMHTAARVRIISSDKAGNIFVGSTLGLIVFAPDFESFNDIEYHSCISTTDENSLNANDIFDICTTQDGETFLAVFGGGISKVIENDKRGFPLKFKSFTTENGMLSNVTISLQDDNQGNIWVCTEGSLTKFNTKSETFENFSEINRLIKQQSFSENSRCKTYDGKMLFGYSKGVVYFNTYDIKINTYNPYLALVQLRLFNKDLIVGEKGVLDNNIDDTQKLKLKHNQNFLSIKYAALDYKEPSNIRYTYKLEGFDKDWVYASKERVANYTNLSKGMYVFKVKSTNSDGVWISNERSLDIEILPPLWRTWWAYLFYFILFILTLYFSLLFFINYYRIRNEVEVEHRESELKTRFFTDISHEIRTPLTMIVSPIENILESDETPEFIKKQLSLVSKNTNRLLVMVNQILDFRKIEQKSLEVSKIEIGKFVEGICNDFAGKAEKQNIEFIVENRAGNQVLWLDEDGFERILINLLSNSFKYTPSHKMVKVSTFSSSDFIGIKVEDTGVGISKDKQSRLFKRFESFNEDDSKPSTGIGLSIVKEIVDKHNAKIFVESEPGKGTVFTLIFTKGIDHLDKSVVIKSKDLPPEKEVTETEIISDDSLCEEEVSEMDDKSTILVVEDDEDLREFICATLEGEYNILEAENGEAGLRMTLDHIPDFIISDIMMPVMNGMEFLHAVRQNRNTSHILFLLLTAKSTQDDKMKGAEFGADEYITKPFSVSFLRARISNLIERRQKVQEYYKQNFRVANDSDNNAVKSESVYINPEDDKFMMSLTDIIVNNIEQNIDFVIEDLSQEMAMSRTVFFKKLKSLTGMSPIEYKRDVTLQQAANLLRTGKYNVKEVSFMVGFTDTKYFSKCFKEKYNLTPSAYIKALK